MTEGFRGASIPRVDKKDIPTITFPTSDFETVARMNNRAVVHVFRQHIWTIRQRLRAQVDVPEEHDAYLVNRTSEGVAVVILHEGREVFRCIFIPPMEY